MADLKPNEEKGISLGPEREGEIASLLKKFFHHWLLPGENFVVKTEICHEFAYVSSSLEGNHEGENFCVEVCVNCEDNNIANPVDAHHTSLDVMQLVFDDFFTSDRVSHYLSIWQEYEMNDQKVRVRIERKNGQLEDQADAFLRAHGFDLGSFALSGAEEEEEDDDE